MISKGEKFTFDDILLVPNYAENDVREFKDATKSNLFNFELDVPIIASPMDSISGTEMMKAMLDAGAIACHHRYCDSASLSYATQYFKGGIAISPSIGIENIVYLFKLNPNNFFVIDVAHGDSKRVFDFCKELLALGITNIISGNIASITSAERYLKIGISHLRAGIGAGSRCLTRKVSGFGYPQASLIDELHTEFPNAHIISDGGCNSTGDVVKSLSFGAEWVMTGFLLAGSSECCQPTGLQGNNFVYR